MKLEDLSGREDLLLTPNTDFDERFEAVMIDMMNGRHSTQIDSSGTGLNDKPEEHETDDDNPTSRLLIYLSLYKSHYIMSRRTDLLQKLIKSDKWGEEKSKNRSFLLLLLNLFLPT